MGQKNLFICVVREETLTNSGTSSAIFVTGFTSLLLRKSNGTAPESDSLSFCE